jgi:hypothetical protein
MNARRGAKAPRLVFVRHGRQLRKCMTSKDGRTCAEVFAEIAREKKRENDFRASARPDS